MRLSFKQSPAARRTCRGLLAALCVNRGKPLAGFLFPVLLGLMAGFFSACAPSVEETPVPPVTPPLSRSLVGYGVVTASYTRVLNEPSLEGVSLGYVREGTILRVLEKRLIVNGDVPEYWVLIEGEYQGWLPLEIIDIYDSEEKAKTAAESSRFRK